MSKLQKIMIRAMYNNNYSKEEIALAYEISIEEVWEIIQEDVWSHLTP